MTPFAILQEGFPSMYSSRFRVFISLIFIVLFFSGRLVALSELNGSVHDAQGKSVAFANVLVLQAVDSVLVKGAVTTEKGAYQIENIQPGKYLISVSMLGYGTEFVALEVGTDEPRLELPPIILKEDVSDLDAVEIRARKPFFEQRIDRLVINVQNSITFIGSTALDILERSPGIIVNRENGTISMGGKSGVVILINGRINRLPMSALVQMLQGMPSSNIEKIELITTPPASFDAEGDAGFVNILLKKNENEGLNGSLTATLGHGRKERMTSGVNLNYRKKKLNIFGDYNFTRNRMVGLIDGKRTIENSVESIETITSTRRDGGFDLHNARLGIDFYLSSKTVVGILGSIFERRWSQESLNKADYLFSLSPPSNHIGIRTDRNNSHQYLFNFNVQHNFNERQRLNFDFDYFDYYSHQPQDYDNRFYNEQQEETRKQEIRIDKTTPLNIWVSKLDYKLKLSDKLDFEAGVKATISDFTNDILVEFNEGNDWFIHPLFSERATFNENISAAYTSFDLRIDEKTSLKAGLRYEFTDTRLESDGENASIKRQYGNFFPSIFLSRNIHKDQSIQFAYSRRISRPTFNQLAPFVLFLEPNTYVTGNSSLLPAITDQFKLDYRIKTVLFSLQYSVDNDAIARFQPRVDPESNLIIYYSENLDKRETFALSLSLPIYVNNWWEMQNQLSASMVEVKSNYNDAALKVSQNNATFNTTQSFHLPKDFTFETVGFYRSGGLSGISRVKPIGGLDIGIRKKLKNNQGVLSFNLSDVFRTKIRRFTTHIPELNIQQSLDINFDTRIARLTYTRNFGSNKIKTSRKRRTGSAEELRRVSN